MPKPHCSLFTMPRFAALVAGVRHGPKPVIHVAKAAHHRPRQLDRESRSGGKAIEAALSQSAPHGDQLFSMSSLHRWTILRKYLFDRGLKPLVVSDPILT